MKPININYAEDPHCVARDLVQALHILERMQRLSGTRPIAASIGLVDDPYSAVLEIGVDGDHGFAKFLRTDEVCWAPGTDPSARGAASYFFQDSEQEVEQCFVTSFEVVQLAVAEFMVRQGARPSVVSAPLVQAS